MSDKDQLKQLLREAEAKISELATENASLGQAYFQLMEAQKLETLLIVQLTEQIWALEEALAGAHGEKSQVADQLKKMKKQFETLRAQANETLKAAAANASRLELAARVYELAKVAQADELDRKLAEYNANLGKG